jgi:DNA-binding transcriptional MerR regulator
MPDIKDTPTYNLKAVIQETGLKPDTLRAWERRYGLPKPRRTQGKHRLYSQRDIGLLKWLIARQEEGLSISRAVEMWRSLEADGQDPLQAVATAQPAQAAVSGGAIDDLRAAWLKACMAFDEQSAENVLAQAFALYPPEAVCFEVLQRGLSDIGEGWYRGEVTIQQEHFASALANRRLATLIASTPAPSRSGRIVVACPPEEEHAFSAMLIAFVERRRGWDVLFLGANVALLRLEAALRQTRPQLVIAPAQQLHTAATLIDMAELARREKVALAFGGLIFNRVPALRDRISGYFLGEQLDRASEVVERLMVSLRPAPEVEPASQAYRDALVQYQEHRAPIEASVWSALGQSDIPRDYLTIANHNLALNVIAALRLGDMTFVGSDLEWVEGLLIHHRAPDGGTLRHYLRAYRKAVADHLGGAGAPIVDWLDTGAGT